MDDARLINIFDEPSSHRSSSYPPSSNSSYGDLLDGLGDSDDPLLNMSHSGTDDHDFFGGATTATAVATPAFPKSSAHEELLNMSAPVIAPTIPVVQTSQHQQHHAAARQQQQSYTNNKVQQMNGSFVSMNIGGAGLQQQPQQGMISNNGTMMNIPQQNKPSSAPSSGNRLKSNNAPNVFDSFQDKQSPFADLGRLL